MSAKDNLINVGLLAAGGVAIAAASGVYAKGSRAIRGMRYTLAYGGDNDSTIHVSGTFKPYSKAVDSAKKIAKRIGRTVEVREEGYDLVAFVEPSGRVDDGGYGKGSRAKRSAQDVYRQRRMPALDPNEFSAIPGMQGPFRYEGGDVLYYDPREGKYYDRRRDMYVGPPGKGSRAKTLSFGEIQNGDRVTIAVRFGAQKTGTAVMRNSYGGWVLNMGGKYGTPGLASEENFVKATRPRGKGSRSKTNAQGLISRLSQIPGVSRAFVSDTWHDGYNRITVVLKTQGTIPVTVEARGAHQNLHQISDYAKTAAAVRAAAKASGLFVEGVVGPKKIYEYVRPQYRRAGDKRESGFDGKEMYVEVYEGKGSMTRDGSYEATLMFDADEDDPARLAQQRLMNSPFAQQARPLTAEPPRITSAQGSAARGSSSVLRGMTSKAGTPIPGPSLKTLDDRLNLGGEEGKSLRYFMTAGKRQAALDYANELLGGNGIEYIESQQDTMRHREGLSYVNMGDTYDTTLIYDHKTGRFYVGAWGDWVERYPKRFG